MLKAHFKCKDHMAKERCHRLFEKVQILLRDQFMSDDTWKTAYDITVRGERIEDGDIGSHFSHHYDVVNRYNGTVVGTYKEYSYAVKQARRRYKKFVKLLERSFTS